MNERRRHFSPPKSHHPTEAETSGLAQIFPAIWSSLEADYGRENLVFPKEIIWLMGSPGAGKGTHSQFLQLARGFSAHTIVSSELLNSPDAQRAKANGGLIDDAVVIEAVLRHLLRPEYQNGVIVDGYPRTPVQVEGIKLLRDKMFNLRQEFASASDRHFR
ncbi:MAG: nucleoside monophosphate kinase, partial [archaeon]|nr:nucleoside monophosphate kinase [archaeon]